MIFYLSFCMYKLNLNRDLKIEEMKINICFLQAYFNEKNRRTWKMQELVNHSKKIIKCMKD